MTNNRIRTVKRHHNTGYLDLGISLEFCLISSVLVILYEKFISCVMRAVFRKGVSQLIIHREKKLACVLSGLYALCNLSKLTANHLVAKLLIVTLPIFLLNVNKDD